VAEYDSVEEDEDEDPKSSSPGGAFGSVSISTNRE
jgi:hypothetical protein